MDVQTNKAQLSYKGINKTKKTVKELNSLVAEVILISALQFELNNFQLEAFMFWD